MLRQMPEACASNPAMRLSYEAARKVQFFANDSALLTASLKTAGNYGNAIQSIPTTDREAVGALLKLDKYIDTIVPRGGKGLIRRIMEETRILW